MKTLIIVLLLASNTIAGTFSGSTDLDVFWQGGQSIQRIDYDFTLDRNALFTLRKWEVWSIDSQSHPSKPTWWLMPLEATLTETDPFHWRDLLDVVDNRGQANFFKVQVAWEDTPDGIRMLRFAEVAHQHGEQLTVDVVLNPTQDFIHWYNFGSVSVTVPEPSTWILGLLASFGLACLTGRFFYIGSR